MTEAEQLRAERVSEVVDLWLTEPDVDMTDLGLEETALLETAQLFARLPALLDPVEPSLAQRVMAQVRAGEGRPRRRRRFSPAWVGAAVAVLLVLTILTPAGRTAVAGFMTVFHLGRTEVRITPASVAATAEVESAARSESMTLDEAQARVAFTVQQPQYLPPGYRLLAVTGFTYPDLPAWLPQPFSLELRYADEAGDAFAVRLYPITLDVGDRATIAGMNLEAAPIRDVQDVDLGGKPAVLLSLGRDDGEATWHELVWEQDDLMVVLTTSALTEAELLDVARSVR